MEALRQPTEIVVGVGGGFSVVVTQNKSLDNSIY